MITTRSRDHPTFDHKRESQSSNICSRLLVLIIGWSRLLFMIKCLMIKTPGCDQMLDDQDSWLWSNVGWLTLLVVIKCWMINTPGHPMIITRSLNHPTFHYNQECWSSNIRSQPGVMIIHYLIITWSLYYPTFNYNQELWSNVGWSTLLIVIKC